MSNMLLDAALYWQNAGCAVIPAATDGTKRPFGQWAKYQQQRPTEADQYTWFGGGDYDGLGLVCGEISGNLEMFELEGRAVAEGIDTALADLMDQHGFADLWQRISDGYLERTPSGGLHWLIRVDGTVRNNLKLARRPATPDELADNPDERVKVLIETRGEGGFTIVAPSGGRTHPGRGKWTRLAGSPTTIPTISDDERDALHAIAAMLDRMPAHDAPKTSSTQRERPEDDLRPGDDYNQRAQWRDILTPHGWSYAHPLGAGHAWTRPGKTRGISATTGRNDGDNLYVFSSSTVFDTETAYSKFAAYTLLNHDGDWTAAARQLAADGYGTRRLHSVPDDWINTLPGATPTSINTTAERTPNPLPALNLNLLTERCPDPDWLVEDRITTSSLTLLGAKPGIGKSWTALDLSLALTTGRPWLGHEVPQKRRVLYIDVENGETLARRRLQQLGADPALIQDRLHYVTEAVMFPGGEDSHRYQDTLNSFRPDLIVVDTLASAAPSAESDTESMSLFLSDVWHRARANGAAVLILAHLRKSQQGAGKDDPLDSFRGAGHLVGAASRAWLLEPRGPERFVLRDVKTREFPAVPPTRVLLLDEELPTGDVVDKRTSVVVDGHEFEDEAETPFIRYQNRVLTFIDNNPTGIASTAPLLTLGDGETDKTLRNWLSQMKAAGVVESPRKGCYRRAQSSRLISDVEETA